MNKWTVIHRRHEACADCERTLVEATVVGARCKSTVISLIVGHHGGQVSYTGDRDGMSETVLTEVVL